jgi:hypothetical protein
MIALEIVTILKIRSYHITFTLSDDVPVRKVETEEAARHDAEVTGHLPRVADSRG